MRKILIISQTQFGYLTDVYKYCEHLNKKLDITVLCWDYNKKRMEIPNVKINYVSRDGNLIKRNIRFIKACFNSFSLNYDRIFMIYFYLCSLLALRKKVRHSIILDFRTASVSKFKIVNFFWNTISKIEAGFFLKKTAISEGVAKILKLRNYSLLPLGADIIKQISLKKNSFNLLYVGTFANRDLEKTIYGFHEYCKSVQNDINISYTLIGSGWNNERRELQQIINAEHLDDKVKLVGEKYGDELTEYYNQCDIGISFIPITSYFDHQPPTKTFEYLLSGLPVIATATHENKKIINKKNGVLIDDTIVGFKNGLQVLLNSIGKYKTKEIQDGVKENSWAYICEKYFLSIID
jgi:glycosyltransferase involved in cell wall biosynthesis